MKTTIVLADDHDLVEKSIAALLRDEPGFEVIAECHNGRELLAIIERLRPNVAIVDVAMPEMNGIEAALRIRVINRGTRVIILSSYADDAYVEDALKAGIVGYIVKSGVANDLINAIHLGTRSKPYLSTQVAAVVERLRTGSPHPASGNLSPRQREVLQLVVEGYSSAKIAALLGIAEGTVKDHRKHIKEKLNIHSIAELTRYAISKQIIRADGLLVSERWQIPRR